MTTALDLFGPYLQDGESETEMLMHRAWAEGYAAAQGKQGENHERESVHLWFNLTYANYAVLHRTLLQSMPDEWQARFVQCMQELDNAYAHLKVPSFKIETGHWHYPDDLSDEKLTALGWEYSDNREEIFDPEGKAWSPHQECVFIPCDDPIPHYERGRAYVEPRFEAVDE